MKKKNDEVIHFNNKIELNRQFEQQDEEIINEKHNIDINEPPPIEFNQIPKINELRKSDDNNMIFKQPKKQFMPKDNKIVNSSKNFKLKQNKIRIVSEDNENKDE